MKQVLRSILGVLAGWRRLTCLTLQLSSHLLDLQVSNIGRRARTSINIVEDFAIIDVLASNFEGYTSLYNHFKYFHVLADIQLGPLANHRHFEYLIYSEQVTWKVA